MAVLEIMQETLMGRSGCVLLHVAREMHRVNTIKTTANLLKISLLLALLPASASAALIVSDWTATPTSLSFKITGPIDEGVPFGTATQLGHSFIGPSSLPQDPEKDSFSLGMVTSLGGSPTALGNITDLSGDEGAVIFNDFVVVNIQIEKANDAAWQTGDILNYSISFMDVGLYDFHSWDPSGAIVFASRSGIASAPKHSTRLVPLRPSPTQDPQRLFLEWVYLY